MTLEYVGSRQALDRHDAQLLRQHLADPFGSPVRLDLTTVDGEQFQLGTCPDGTPRRIVGLPWQTGTIEFGGYSYPAIFTYSIALNKIVAFIEDYGIWRSGHLSTCHEQL